MSADMAMDDRLGLSGHGAPVDRPPSMGDVQGAVGEVHEACAALAASIRAMAYALSDPVYYEQPTRLSSSSRLDIRSVTWRLHHLADVMADCRAVSMVVLEALDALPEPRPHHVDARAS